MGKTSGCCKHSVEQRIEAIVIGHQFAGLLALVLAFTLLVLARGQGDCWSPIAFQLITARDPEELQLQC